MMNLPDNQSAPPGWRVWLSTWLPRVGLLFFWVGSVLLIFLMRCGFPKFYVLLSIAYCLLGLVLTLAGFVMHKRARHPLMILIQILLVYLLLAGILMFRNELMNNRFSLSK